MTATSTVALSVKIGLRFTGIWPGSPYSLLCRCAWILTTGIVQTCQYWYIIIHFGTSDLSLLMDSLSVALEYSVMFVKLIILWLNSRIFYDILATMAADWRDVAVSDVGIMTRKAALSRFFSNMIIGVHSAASLSYGIGVLVSNADADADADVGADAAIGIKPAREFTLKMQLPFECDESPMYELVMCMEFLHQLASSATTGMLNSLIITLILHTCGQIEILCDALRKISRSAKGRRAIVSIAREVICKHQRIISLSNKIEGIFCYAALVQFMSSTLVACCLGYMIVTSIGRQSSDTIDSSALMKAMVFYMAVTVEAFVFCYSGEYLSAKSKMIGDAAYKSLWYDLEPSESKLILFIIMRSQRRLTITAGKVMDLSLEGFTSIIKASVSYVSVLHAMY